MSGSYFLDTNIFIYALDRSDTKKHQISKELITQALTTGKFHISFQVVQEFINVSLKKLSGFSVSDCNEYLDAALFPILTVYPSKELYRESLIIHQRWKYGFYDSLVIAAAKQVDANTIYSEDLQDGQSIGSTKIVNPFK